jgi:hypothetical protein
MGKRSRAKGANGELEVAKLLEPWWRQCEDGCHFRRTPGSGGWGRSSEVRAGFNASGDLSTDADLWPFCIEIKRREGWAWENVWLGKRSPVWGWWRQCQDAAKECGKLPMMFFRHNHEAWSVMLPDSHVALCGLANELAGQYWEPGDLARIDYGDHLPMCTTESALFALPPRTLILPTKTGIRATGKKKGNHG